MLESQKCPGLLESESFFDPVLDFDQSLFPKKGCLSLEYARNGHNRARSTRQGK
jgi:hypothetical protein